MVSKFTIKRSRDNKKLAMDIPGDGTTYRFEMDASQAEWMIAQIANGRTAMVPAVSDEPPNAMQSMVNVAWRTAVVPEAPDGVQLLLRHPGLGWLSFHLPRGEALSLADWLARPFGAGSESETPTPGSGPLH